MPHARNRERNPQQRNHDRFDWITLGTAIAGVVILCGYTGLTGYQAYVARDTERRQLRAYLYVNFGDASNLLKTDEPPVVVIQARHGGETPAYNVKIKAFIAPLPYPLPVKIADISKSEPSKRNSAFLYKEPHLVLNDEYDRVLTADQKSVIESGESVRLYVWGEVTYIDAFDENRYVHFCVMFGSKTLAKGQYEYCTENYNDAN